MKNYLSSSFQDPAKVFTRNNWLLALEYWNHRCAICGREAGGSLTIAPDHWMPRSKGGLTALDNIVPLCHGKGGCNNSKGKSHPDRWLRLRLGTEGAAQKQTEIAAYFAYMLSIGTIPVVRLPRRRKPEWASKQITISRAVKGRLCEFSRGLGATYDETIDLLLRLAMNPGEDEMLAGRRLRDKLTQDDDEPPATTAPSVSQRRTSIQEDILAWANGKPLDEPQLVPFVDPA